MDKLMEAALSFQRMTNIQYKFVLGRKGQTYSFTLYFDKTHFPHIAGFQYITDLSIGTTKSAMIFDSVLNGSITYDYLSKSRFFNCDPEHKIIGVESRILALPILESLLDDNNIVFRFDANRIGGSNIVAEYLIHDRPNKALLFIDKCSEGDLRYCRSFFVNPIRDFTANQMLLTLLYKEKLFIDTQTSIVLYDSLSKDSSTEVTFLPATTPSPKKTQSQEQKKDDVER